jgi:hypothetical protein
VRDTVVLIGILMVAALQAATTWAQAPADSVPDNRELARRLDLLAREVDDLRLGPAAGPPISRWGLGPAASKVYDVTEGVSIGGYGEMLLEGYADERQDSKPAGRVNRIDFLRQIVYVGYKFDDRLLFNSEVEFEHASTEDGGSVAVEFAHVDALLRREVNLRAGMVLVPMGFLSELHEPPVFLGTHRTETERRIVPSTWRANGIGLFGESARGFAYRAYLIESLHAGRFDDTGLREGRQNGAKAVFDDVAGVLRVEYAPPGLRAGGALFHGDAAQDTPAPAGRAFDAATTIWEAHLEARRMGLRLRGLVAGARVDDAADLDASRGLTGDGDGRSVGSELLGWFLEAGYDLFSRLRPGTSYEVVPFVRFEAVDTQAEVPAGFTKNPANDLRITTAGASFYPHPQVVLKADHEWIRNRALTGTNRWNVGLGYLF